MFIYFDCYKSVSDHISVLCFSKLDRDASKFVNANLSLFIQSYFFHPYAIASNLLVTLQSIIYCHQEKLIHYIYGELL